MEKYLGNKRVLLNDIYNFTQENCPKANSVFDVFAGTTNVARFFRKEGFSVIANDINRFTYIIANTYLKLSRYPQFSKLDLPEPSEEELANQKKRFFQMVKKDADTIFPLEQAEMVWKKLLPTTKILIYLNSLTKRQKGHRYFIHDYYTSFGRYSDFESVRGTKGKRNYFSKENAVKIDNVLNVLKSWWEDKLINRAELFMLMTSLLEEINLVANVNGTFHDFNRNKLWPNALQVFHLKTPLTFACASKNTVLNLDAVDAASKAPRSDVLYIDPPYNFRQYSAYYHFLNFIAAYPFLDCVHSYLKEISFVRGQHPEDDFTSDFCFKHKFMDALHALIDQTPCRYVVMSYYGGRNHWNHWSKTETPTDDGFHILNDYFNDASFYAHHKSSSLQTLRQNYQSRVGEKKSIIDEYLFFAEKKGRKPVSQRPKKQKYFEVRM